MIEQGASIPAVPLTQVTANGPETINADELLAGKKAVLFAVPGAFTPTCSVHHLPGFVVLADKIKAKGVDLIACVAVNDAFVMKAWGEQNNAEEITLLADGGGAFTKALGLDMDTGDFGGLRSQRYAMIVEDGVIKHLSVDAPKQFELSKAEAVLERL